MLVYKLLHNKYVILWMYHSLIVFLLIGIRLFLVFCSYKRCCSKPHLFLSGSMLKLFLQLSYLEIELSGWRVFSFKVLRSIKWNNLWTAQNCKLFISSGKGLKKIIVYCHCHFIKGHFNTQIYLVSWKSHCCHYFSHFTIDYWKFSHGPPWVRVETWKSLL